MGRPKKIVDAISDVVVPQEVSITHIENEPKKPESIVLVASKETPITQSQTAKHGGSEQKVRIARKDYPEFIIAIIPIGKATKLVSENPEIFIKD